MKTVTIGDARSFSLEHIQKNDLVSTGDLQVRLLCFEAGQRDDERSLSTGVVYQVLEGELLVRSADDRHRVGKGKVMAVPAGSSHVLENAGGGLLVVMATTPR